MSSSGHLALVPRLLGWDYADLPADARKTFEVALHAGSAPALALALRGGHRCATPHLQALTFAAAGRWSGSPFERPIERRLGGLRSVAVAQIVAGAALLAADLRPERRLGGERARPPARSASPRRPRWCPGCRAQERRSRPPACAGCRGPAAAALSLRAALPVTVGAGLLKGVRAARDGVPAELRGAGGRGRRRGVRIRARGTARWRAARAGGASLSTGSRSAGVARARVPLAREPRLGWNLQWG